MDTLTSRVNDWLRQIGEAQGAPLALDDQGQTCIRCDENTLVFVEVPSDTPAVFMYAPIVRLPDSPEAQIVLLKQALTLNLFGLETGGASLSFDPRTQSIILSFALKETELDQEFFSAALGSFIELAISLLPRLKDQGTPAVSSPQSYQPFPPMGSFA